VTIYHADCRDILPLLDESIDLVLTDPPYPDQHPEYGEVDLSFLNNYTCRQLVFWSNKVDFPLDYTAIHIWAKGTGCGSQYERIFERNGGKAYNLYYYYFVNSPIGAKFARDEFMEHETQKPIQLLLRLVADYSKLDQVVLDPFLGSGTTMVAVKKLNRRCIGIEIEEKYCEMAAKRLSQSVMELAV